MDETFLSLTRKMELTSGASDDELRKLAASLPFNLPDDYISFMKTSNGAKGIIGNNFLVIYRVEELDFFNKGYEIKKYLTGFYLFGTDGGGDGYGFDYRQKNITIVQLPFIGMDWKIARIKGANFMEFLLRLGNEKF